jgi:dihydroorotate dehydrogenase
MDPERAHRLTLSLLRLAGALPPIRSGLRRIFSVPDPRLQVNALGLTFANPVGLAAGYDKNGLAMHGLACLGFGHLEIGTVTPRAQQGNPRPRLFRLQEDRSLINRMGFPNRGAKYLLARLRRRPNAIVVGVNIGKGSGTPLEDAEHDYLELTNAFYKHADYLAVNVSSPNTIGLRRLQARHYLEGLLESINGVRISLERTTGRYTPLLVKLAPDLNPQELADAVQAILGAGMDGIIATNTTTQRLGLRSPHQSESGGTSGEALKSRATEVIRQIHDLTAGSIPIIGVGGISAPEDATEKLEAGAVLVQLYTGLVYRGPGVVRQILVALANQKAPPG